jgi:hypothetical protein
MKRSFIMKIHTHIGVVVLSAAGLVMIAPAATNAAPLDIPVLGTPADRESIEGTIASVSADDQSFILKTESGKRLKIAVNDDTQYTLNGERASMAQALKPGADARVVHKDHQAVRVDVTADVTPS